MSALSVISNLKLYLDKIILSLADRYVRTIPRNRYKSVWNSISISERAAKIAVSGSSDDNSYAQSAQVTLQVLQDCVGIGKDDVVLEIGAGVGRVGAVVAPLCKEWIGTDVSENMVRHIRRRLAKYNNIRAIAINGFDLAAIPTASVDVVYCTVVFMHLEEWERYGYVAEGLRVLKPGGRMLVDNVNILSNGGWTFFEEHCRIPPAKRVAYLSKTSTPQEQQVYFWRSGFVDVRQRHQADFWITTYGLKPQINHHRRNNEDYLSEARLIANDLHLIVDSGLVDCEYYLKVRPDVAATLETPFLHYLRSGAAEGLWPCALFDPRYYASQCPDLGNENPLAHFIRVGVALGLKPHALFDTAFYLSCHGGQIPPGMNPLAHFLTAGGIADFNPHPLFDSSWYRSHHPNVRFDQINPLVHYITEGWRGGAAPHPQFDGELYLQWNPDVKAADINPLEHFVRYGQSEGRPQPKKVLGSDAR